MAHTSHVASIRTMGEAMAAICAPNLGSPIEFLPGWKVLDLVKHLGSVYAYGAGNVAAASTEPAAPDPSTASPQESEINAWFLERLESLVFELESAPLDRVAWSHAGIKNVEWWHRRMYHETAIHLWDARAATANPEPLEADLARDGIDEYFEVSADSTAVRPGFEFPEQSLHLHCTDGPGEWMIERGDQSNELLVAHEHRKGAAAVKGSASELLLWVWGRPSPGVEIFGDAEVAAAWQSLAP